MLSCLHCNEEASTMTSVKRRIVIYIIVGLVAVLLIGAMVLMNPGASEGSLLAPVGETIATAGESVAELLSLGQRYLLELNFEAAIVTFTRVIEIEPRNVEALVGRGTAHVLWQEDLDAARADFELALSIDERSVGAYLGLVDIYIRLGDFDRALELARLGYEMTGDAALREMVEALEGGTVRDSEGRVRRVRHYYGGEFLFSQVNIYAQGKQISITTYDPAGNLIAHGDIVYDEQGNQWQLYGVFGQTGELYRREHTYDSAGRLVRTESFIDGQPSNYTLHEYGNDNVRVRSEYWVDGRITSYGIYNSQGHMMRRNFISRDGQLTSFQLFERDTNGNTIRNSVYGADGTLTRYTVIERDADGNTVSLTTYSPDGTITGRIVYDNAQPVDDSDDE